MGDGLIHVFLARNYTENLKQAQNLHRKDCTDVMGVYQLPNSTYCCQAPKTKGFRIHVSP